MNVGEEKIEERKRVWERNGEKQRRNGLFQVGLASGTAPTLIDIPIKTTLNQEKYNTRSNMWMSISADM